MGFIEGDTTPKFDQSGTGILSISAFAKYSDGVAVTFLLNYCYVGRSNKPLVGVLNHILYSDIKKERWQASL